MSYSCVCISGISRAYLFGIRKDGVSHDPDDARRACCRVHRTLRDIKVEDRSQAAYRHTRMPVERQITRARPAPTLVSTQRVRAQHRDDSPSFSGRPFFCLVSMFFFASFCISAPVGSVDACRVDLRPVTCTTATTRSRRRRVSTRACRTATSSTCPPARTRPRSRTT